MKNLKRLMSVIVLSALSGVASAIPIIGTINIGGASTVENDGLTSTGVTFGGGSVNNFPVPTGTFNGLGGIDTAGTGGDLLTLTSFMYTDIPERKIWEIDLGSDGSVDYSFTLTSVSVVSESLSLLTLKGTGFFDAVGFDRTYGSWSYSQSGASFSSQSVPEPTVALLLGMGLLGFGFARKARKSF